jgi:hypothetical protein
MYYLNSRRSKMSDIKERIDYTKIPLKGRNGYLPLFPSKSKPGIYYYATFGFLLTKELIETGRTGLGLPKMKCISIITFTDYDQFCLFGKVDDMPLDHLCTPGFSCGNFDAFSSFYTRKDPRDVEINIYELAAPDEGLQE